MQEAYMKGLEIAKRYYIEFGAPMLHNNFPELESIIAVGLVGDGSECFGYDDDISQDHDFEPGFCMFVPDDTDSKTLFRLEREYAALPGEFLGLKRNLVNPAGGSRHGIIKTGDFYLSKIGRRNAFENSMEWFGVPDCFLCTATNGEIFRDDKGAFSAIRKSLIDIPEDIRLKKLAGHLVLMSQAGQYNYGRCIDHMETAAAQLSVIEFVHHSMAAVFLLNRRYMPFYKWSFRAYRELEQNFDIAEVFEFLITTDNSNGIVQTKKQIIRDVSGIIADELKKQKLSEYDGEELDRHGLSVNNKIKDPSVRNLNILYAVQ